MKKHSLTAVVLVLTLIFTFAFGTAASAAEAPELLTAEQADNAAAGIIREFTGAQPDADIVFHDDMAEAMDANSDGAVTADEAVKAFSGYVYASESSLDDALRIADESQYRVTVLEDGRKTVYIFVDVKNNPELFDLDVFAECVQYIYEKQQQTASDAGGEGFSLLTYEQIAGELALHAVVYSVTDTLGGEQGGNVFHDYYESAKEAQLNIDETRVPAWFINILGQLIKILRNLFAAL